MIKIGFTRIPDEDIVSFHKKNIADFPSLYEIVLKGNSAKKLNIDLSDSVSLVVPKEMCYSDKDEWFVCDVASIMRYSGKLQIELEEWN